MWVTCRIERPEIIISVNTWIKMARRGQPRKFFIQRDYTNGTAVRFVTDFPTELRGRVSM